MTAPALRIGIDARELLGHATGVGRYLAELRRALDARRRAAPRPQLVLFAPAPLPAAPWLGTEAARVELAHVPGGIGHRVGAMATCRAPRGADALSVFFAPAYTAAPVAAPCPAWSRSTT